MTKQEFITKFNNKHPDLIDKFDFSNLPNNLNRNIKQIFICKEHGPQLPRRIDAFLFDGVCQTCSKQNRHELIIGRKISIEDFIKKCQYIYVWQEDEPRDKNLYPTGTPKYDYSITKEFRPIPNTRSKFEFDYICPIHGKQTQRVDTHENGHGGCVECGHILSGINQRISGEEFFDVCRKIHVWKENELRDKNLYPTGTPKYDYSNSIYTGYSNYFKAYCPLHNHEFTVLAINHYQGNPGCEYCSNSGTSKLEQELSKYIKSIYFGEIILNKRILDGKEIDVYLPELKIGFEFNGLLWHSEYNNPNKKYHQEKYLSAVNKDIHLINIWEDDWSEKQIIIKSRIKQILNITENKIRASNTYIKQVSIKEEKDFLITNHLQEYINSEICYGLYLKNTDELVSLMSFGKLRFEKQQDNVWELLRFCIKNNTKVYGAASKLFNHFINKFNPKQIISYANCDWSINNEHNVYNQLRFKYSGITVPDYSLVIGKTRHSRQSFTKDKLIKKYNCPESLTEHEFCKQQGWYRIYGTGQLKYIWSSN